MLHTLQSESFTKILLFSTFDKTIPGLFALHSVGSGILQDETADGPRALFIAGSDGRILRAWLPEDAGCSGSKDMAHAVAEAIERASEASSVPWFQTL